MNSIARSPKIVRMIKILQMSNSKIVKERVSRDYECVTCGWSEFDIRETTAVSKDSDQSIVGERYEQCRNCGETYATVGRQSDHVGREAEDTAEAEDVLNAALDDEVIR